MDNTQELFGAMANIVEDNTSEDGIDVVNVYGTLIEELKATGGMDVESWELLRLSIVNGSNIATTMIDAEIAKLQTA